MATKQKRKTGKAVRGVQLPSHVKGAGIGKLAGRVEVSEGVRMAPVKVSLWRRLVAFWRAPDNQWDDLKHRVMDELKQRQEGGGVEVQSQPFVKPLLPEHGKVRQSNDWLFVGFVSISLLAIVVLLMMGGRASGPEAVLGKLAQAWRSGDAQALARAVDTEAVAMDVVTQLYAGQVLDFHQVPDSLKTELQAGDDVGRMIRDGLVEMLEEEIVAAARTGVVDASGSGPLAHMWREIAGDKLIFGKPRLRKVEGDTATAEVLVARADSSHVAEIVQLSLAKRDGVWKVVGVPNIGSVLARLGEIEMDVAAAEVVMGSVEPSRVGMGSAIRVSRVEKEVSRGKTMNVVVEMANTSGAPVDIGTLKLVFADARGVPLRVVTFEDNTPLGAGLRRTRTLPIPVDRRDAKARWVAELPLSALTVQAEVVAGGRAL